MEKEAISNQPLKDEPSKDEPNQSEGTAISTIPAIDKLRRFCFIGSTDEPVYTTPALDLVVENNFASLKELCSQVSEDELVECLLSVLGSEPNEEQPPRPDEPLLILAVFFTTCEDEKKRNAVRNRFTDLITSESDLLLFVQLVKRVQKLLERKTPFNRTVRKAVLNWYGTKSLDRLLHFWSIGDGNRWPAHRDLLYRLHFRHANFLPEIIAALRLLSSSPKELSQWPDFLTPLTSFRETIEGVVKLRLLTDPEQAISIVKKLSLSWEHVPFHLLHDPRLAHFLIPHMSYEQLLQKWPRLSRLNSRVRPFAEQLLDKKKLKASNVPPVRLLLEDMRLRKPKKVVNQLVLPSSLKNKNTFKFQCATTSFQKASFLHSVYEISFGLNKALGRRLHITLNLEQAYLGKYLSGPCRSLKYLDALVALGFGYFRSDRKVTVEFWHDRSGKLKALPWTNEMSVSEAKTCCENQKVGKVRQSLNEILFRALLDMQNTFDVFLVLVPGAARGNPENNSKCLAALMDKYREKRNSNAKFIMVSLRQRQRSMIYSSGRNENLLELCSLDKHTPRLINAFVRNKFY
nr:uncharacterized protein Dmel_CG10803, isoform B [Drosophila melanogaster]NP_001259214.1 uncharacterized protein Dmel_CG10803, isoform C [Drosophila melanogaster]NP_001259215.1 uncharacterized protein Dmel_CG10803, isoform D [Drosophila melanogaster]AGB95059.1 uncharacterized protein Dmel_CG10803, isoform B [Drosophila melanogaster]AGB95060.1 uncharacterized protein Dmel_CG10803, isoform C [Drosophila melanogaster]AGB95061.1 uncharacterized protein Dmel_CG10803, isoform D [Drosophila melanog|eukprot:NP_001259213.1 uncharacterized protein Dmel_CG10803, isoform B [Drosophila melanogaster]